MRHSKKIALFLVLGLFSLASSLFALDGLMKKQGGLGYISSAVEAMRLRRAHPAMPADLIQKQAAKANHGALGVLETLRNVASGKPPAVDSEPGKPANEQHDTYIRVAENKDAILKQQLPDSHDAPMPEIKGAVQKINANSDTVAVQSTGDGREVIGILHNNGTEDLNAMDRINALNIPDNMKQTILKNYELTGVLPEILVKEKRKPSASADGFREDEDPYNPKNF